MAKKENTDNEYEQTQNGVNNVNILTITLEPIKKSKSTGKAKNIANKDNILKVENKFFKNEKNLKNHYGVYAEQSKIFYNFTKQFTGNVPSILNRMNNTYITQKPMLKDVRGNNQHLTNHALSASRINLSPYIDSERKFADIDSLYSAQENFNNNINQDVLSNNVNAGITGILGEENKTNVTAEQEQDNSNKISTKKEEEISALKPARDVFFKTLNKDRIILEAPFNSPEEREKHLKSVKWNTVFNKCVLHKTFYHEMFHAMCAIQIRRADKTELAPAEYRQEHEIVCYIQGNKITEMVIKDNNGNHYSKIFAGAKYLEEGIVDSLAIDCLMQELKVTQDKNLKSYYPEDIRYRLYQNSGYKPMLTLVGLFNSVSKNQLTLEHFGVSRVNDDYKEINHERANIFKNKFYAYIDVLSDNRYNEDAQDFTEKDIDKILSSYDACLNTCLDGFEMGLYDEKAKIDESKFIEYMSFATADEYVYNGLLKFIKFNDEQKAETLAKIAEHSRVVEDRFQQILQEYQAKSENIEFLEQSLQREKQDLLRLFTPKHLIKQYTISDFQQNYSNTQTNAQTLATDTYEQTTSPVVYMTENLNNKISTTMQKLEQHPFSEIKNIRQDLSQTSTTNTYSTQNQQFINQPQQNNQTTITSTYAQYQPQQQGYGTLQNGEQQGKEQIPYSYVQQPNNGEHIPNSSQQTQTNGELTQGNIQQPNNGGLAQGNTQQTQGNEYIQNSYTQQPNSIEQTSNVSMPQQNFPTHRRAIDIRELRERERQIQQNSANNQSTNENNKNNEEMQQ